MSISYGWSGFKNLTSAHDKGFFRQENKKISYDTRFFAMLTKRGFMIAHQFSTIYFV